MWVFTNFAAGTVVNLQHSARLCVTCGHTDWFLEAIEPGHGVGTSVLWTGTEEECKRALKLVCHHLERRKIYLDLPKEMAYE